MDDYVRLAVESLQQVRDQLVNQLDRLDAALAALGPGKKASRPPQARKPCCTKDDVITIVAGLLRDNGQLTLDELEGLAKGKIKDERQMSLSGFAMRFKEALADSRFREVGENIFALATCSGISDEQEL